MTWNPTHVQLTVLRARNLPTKGKGGAKLNDVFVTIQLAKEKFQTSTIKHAVNPEWFEQCDLAIPTMQSEIQIHVMHRGMLTDDFIGYCTVPLWEHNLYERPKSQWIHLQGKPHKPPDNKIRGDIEVRLSFHVKSTTEEALTVGVKKSKSPSLKALTNISQKVGDKLKLARSKSLREPRSHDTAKHGNGVLPRKLEYGEGGNNTISHQESPLTNPGNHSFSAVDVNIPEFDSNSGMERMQRSYSMQGQTSMADDVHYNMHMAGNRQSLPPSYWATQTLPYSKGKRYGMSNHRSAENVNTLSPGQPGYLENMFKKENEVYQNMQQQELRRQNSGSPERHQNSGSSEDEQEGGGREKPKMRKIAREYLETHKDSSDSDSERSEEEEDVVLPEVRRKESVHDKIQENTEPETDGVRTDHDESTEVEKLNNLSPTIPESPSQNQEESEVDGKFTTTETPPSGNAVEPVYQNSKDENKISETPPEKVPSVEKPPVERELTAPPRNRKKIAPSQNFTFGQSPDKPEDVNLPKRRPKKERDKIKLYKQGGRRYTVQGLDLPRRQNSDDALVDLRPQFPQEMAIPRDLISVYRNMTKEELIQLVIQHKAQLIRKDQYLSDMEEYIDNLLVRVMESSPRLLQNSNPPRARHWHL